MTTEISGNVWVSVERLRALEALEAQMPSLLEKAKTERDKEKLDTLHAKQKADPTYSKKVLEKYHKNKEEINARRREAYKAKKEAATKVAGSA